tara:strand:+ start:245 stop:484 length:240 start_codon:yes stop_codon:yes gene_type:complete
MDFIQEAILSRNIVVWIILVVLLILTIKLLQTAGKGLIMLLITFAVILIITKVFPSLMEPVIDFLRGGWMGGTRSSPPL